MAALSAYFRGSPAVSAFILPVGSQPTPCKAPLIMLSQGALREAAFWKYGQPFKVKMQFKDALPQSDMKALDRKSVV